MPRLPAARLLAVPLTAATLVLAGCGGSSDPGSTAASAEPSASSSSSSPSADVRTQAEKAEQEARKQTSSARPKPSTPPTPRYRHPVLGADVSWPQCPKGTGIPERQGLGLPPPLPEAEFVVIGLTNGPGFTRNPCLADQLRQAKQRKMAVSAYAVVSWPAADRYGGIDHDGPFDGATELGRLRNAGYQQGRFNVRTMKELGFRTPAVWVDVEPYPVFPWPDDTRGNAAVVEGAVRAYREAGYTIGTYSTQSLWQTVAGDLRFGVREWRAAGNTSREEALKRCGPDRAFQGGKALITQWTDGRRDFNITCPGAARDLGKFFHQY